MSSDDKVKIANISGAQVQLTTPLQFSHQAPDYAPGMEVHVANLSRNVRIFSENPNITAKRRGHVMFMHNLDVDLRYVAFINLGRTDKAIPLDDYSWNDLQESASYQPPRGEYNNPRGRYSLHFHRGGVSPDLKPAHIEGVSVNNDPGWAFCQSFKSCRFHSQCILRRRRECFYNRSRR